MGRHVGIYVYTNRYPKRFLFPQLHLKYPLYGTGSSAITFYSETVQKTGPVSYLFCFFNSLSFDHIPTLMVLNAQLQKCLLTLVEEAEAVR